MNKQKKLVFTSIDLNLCRKNSDSSTFSDHPHIKLDQPYLVKIDGHYYYGEFSEEWYGLNFKGIYNAGCQWNYDWQGLWEICQ